VSSVASFGLFVQLSELYVEGLVHISELGGEYYHFDEVRQELRGERTGIRYAVGTKVRVQVSRVDLDGRKIDFRLVKEVDPGRAAAKQAVERAGRKKASATRPARGDAAREPISAVEALDEVRRVDRAVKQQRKAAAEANPVRAAKQAAKRASKSAAKSAAGSDTRKASGKTADRAAAKAASRGAKRR
jgi:ribonuclease R